MKLAASPAFCSQELLDGINKINPELSCQKNEKGGSNNKSPHFASDSPP
jgi:hypothetical protein